MEGCGYRAANISTTSQMQFQVLLNRARPAAIKCSDGDRQNAKQQLDSEFHQVTPVKCMHFDYSNIISNYYCMKLGQRQLVPESSSPKDLHK